MNISGTSLHSRAQSFRLLHQIELPDTLSYKGLVFSPSGDFSAATCGKEILLWKVRDGSFIFRKSSNNYAFGIAFSPNGEMLAALSF